MRKEMFGRVTLTLVVATGLVGCGSDARFKKVTEGISKDSVSVLSGGAVAQSVATYMTEGHRWDVHFFAKGAAAAGDTLPWRKMTPVVYADDKVVGKGWSFWESKATELRIPLPPK